MGATSVHGFGGLWGILAVGLFASVDTLENKYCHYDGLFHGKWGFLKDLRNYTLIENSFMVFPVRLSKFSIHSSINRLKNPLIYYTGFRTHVLLNAERLIEIFRFVFKTDKKSTQMTPVVEFQDVYVCQQIWF